jgi:MtaA/CmuA family methyltransferase
MNSSDRWLATMAGRPTDRPPNFNIFMTYAAHAIGQPLSRYYLDYRVLCQANYAVQAEFDLDILQAISDPYREAADLGAVVDFPTDGLPLCRTPLLSAPADMSQLARVAPEAGRRMSDRLAAVAAFRQRAGGQTPIMGWVEGALAEAADLRGVGALLTDLIERPEWVGALLDFCVEVEIDFARAQVAAGADIIGLGDAIASQISPRMYRRYGLPCEQRIFAAVHEAGARTRLHICGDTTRLLPDMAASGADIIDLDWMVDLAGARRVLGPEVALCGNIDPVAVLLQGTPEQVRRGVERCTAAAGTRWICAAGCEVPDGTPHANLMAQTEALSQLNRAH